MPILVGIDGTDDHFVPDAQRNRAYDRAFATSFVRRICYQGGPYTRYYRGPVALGGTLTSAVASATAYVVTQRISGIIEPVLLTGYSRGAAGVVAVASMLNRAGIEVEAILLFDCVDRHLIIDAESVPGNCRHVCHCIRDPRAESRESFQNDALVYSPNSLVQYRYFFCTHGGVGGVPWVPEEGQSMSDYIVEGLPEWSPDTKVTFAQDAAGAKAVWSYCRPFMLQHGFITPPPQAKKPPPKKSSSGKSSPRKSHSPALPPVHHLTGVQARLNELGFSAGPVDGLYGAKTKAAVRSFQAKYPRLRIDGIPGPNTQAKLLQVYGS